MSNSDIQEIKLSRGPCFGSCPDFDVVLGRDGSYRYEGHRHVDPIGIRNGHFPEYLFTRLAEVCLALGVLGLDDLYPTDFDDSAHTIVTVQHATGVKIVRDDGGGLMPASLWAFRVVIEHAMREAFEIEDRTRARERKKGKRKA